MHAVDWTTGPELVACRERERECGGECRRRCSKTHHKKPCLFFCNKCCAKCLCVPPGTYGNKNTCPCYDNWKTKKGGPLSYMLLLLLFGSIFGPARPFSFWACNSNNFVG
ncbi:hypothetical protein BAE44_0004906 [Dichanthelium oligosanthes]|uniref:Gibberellin-regulated protein 6 n=1 Tax=Dichanthelium oligosanthes TaxID=888268 RepID=A0A1E5W9R4_9POAL|nr:hypothetical protein BAE44_0004906 [Dichanthelium oligosanthes]